MCQDDLLRLRIALIDDPLDLAVDIGSNTLTVRSRMRQISSDEDFVIVAAVVDHSELRQTFRTGLPSRAGDRRCLLDILGCPRRHVSEDNLLRDPAAERNHNGLQHLILCVEHLVLLRKRHRISCRAHSGRDDGDRVDRSDIREFMEQDCMTCLMVSCDLLFFLGDHLALLLRADPDFDERLLDISLENIAARLLCRKDRSLV